MDSPSFRANTIPRCLQQEDAIIWARAAQSGANPTTLATMHRDKPPHLCSNCKKDGHLASYCIQPGGGMAGKTLDEACTAQRNARRNGRNGNGNRNSQPNPNATITVATSNGATPVTINGQTFFLTPTPSVPTSVNTAVAISDATFPGNLSDYDALSTFTPSVNIALAPPSALPEGATAVDPNSNVGPMPLCDQIEYEAYVAFNGSSHTSVDWNLNSVMSDTAPAIHPVVYTTSHLPLTCGTTIPFILNSGTNCHILPERSD